MTTEKPKKLEIKMVMYPVTKAITTMIFFACSVRSSRDERKVASHLPTMIKNKAIILR